MNHPHLPIFVYGTLKRGHCRARHWPHPPREVLQATVRGRMHDLGAFPALVGGKDLVRGELWLLEDAHLRRTLEVLDRIEGFVDEGPHQYVRRVVECRLEDRSRRQAYVYFYARPEEIAGCPVISPGADGHAVWSGQ